MAAKVGDNGGLGVEGLDGGGDVDVLILGEVSKIINDGDGGIAGVGAGDVILNVRVGGEAGEEPEVRGRVEH